MPLTTGLITNTRDFGTAATNVVVNLNNVGNTAATVEIRLFYVLIPDIKSPLYVTSVPIPANSIRRFTYYVAGVFAYEVQFNVQGVDPSTVIVSTYGLDQFGNLVQEQGILHTEMAFIPALSPTL